MKNAEEQVSEAWARFDRWLSKWREEHPEDERGDLDLLLEEVATWREFAQNEGVL